MIFVKDLNKDIFDSPFLTFLPEYCETCKSPMEIIETFTVLQCSNPKCPSKIAYRLYNLLRDLGITLLDLEDCKNFLTNFNLDNPYSIFLYNPSDGELFDGYTIEKSKELFKELNKKRGMLLWEYVKIGNLEVLSDNAEKLFYDYNSLSAFYTDMNEGGIGFIQEKLLSNSEFVNVDNSILVEAVRIFHILQENKDELEYALEGVVILNPRIKMGVLFVNDVLGFKSNRDFLYAVNKKLKNNIYLYPVYSLNSNVKLVYWEDLGYLNTLVEKIKVDKPELRIVNSETIFRSILETLNGKK